MKKAKRFQKKRSEVREWAGKHMDVVTKPSAQEDADPSSHSEPWGNASGFQRSVASWTRSKNKTVKNNTGKKSRGVSMSITDKILARVPSEGSPVKRYPCLIRSQCGFSTPVWSGSHAPVPIDRRARINFSLSFFDLIKTQGCYQTDLYSSCYLGFTQKSPLWPMATDRVVLSGQGCPSVYRRRNLRKCDSQTVYHSR